MMALVLLQALSRRLIAKRAVEQVWIAMHWSRIPKVYVTRPSLTKLGVFLSNLFEQRQL